MKKLNLFKAFILTTIILAGVSCKKKDDSSAPAPDAQWYFVKHSNEDSAKVEGGYLFLRSSWNGTMGGPNLYTHKSISGDFQLKVKFSNFLPLGNSSESDEVGFVLSTTGDSPSLILAAALLDSIMFIQDNDLVDMTDKYTVGREGEFYVSRTGENITSWMKAGSDTLFFNKDNYYSNDLSFSVLISSNDNTATSTSVHIDDFTIVGGGGSLVSDPFDVDNIGDN